MAERHTVDVVVVGSSPIIHPRIKVEAAPWRCLFVFVELSPAEPGSVNLDFDLLAARRTHVWPGLLDAADGGIDERPHPQQELAPCLPAVAPEICRQQAHPLLLE